MSNPPLPKKRKIRKGTTSCWECKRRKIRCEFASSSHGICEGCERRGTTCLAQDYDNAATNDAAADKRRDTEMRLRIAEEMLERMTEVASRLPPAAGHLVTEPPGDPAPVAQRQEYPRHRFVSRLMSRSAASASSIQVFDSALVDEGVCMPDDATNSSPSSSSILRLDDLRKELYATFPSQRDAHSIISSGNTAAFLQFFTLPYRNLFSSNMRSAASLSNLPDPSSHPVLLARTLLYLANGLQNLHPSASSADQLDCSRSLTELMTEYLDVASLVTSSDQLLGSIEGLECLLLAAAYHTNAGDLRHAWLVIKRAIGQAQLMGLHRSRPVDLVTLSPETEASVSIIWHRLVSQDRYLALMLGLPATIPICNVPVARSLTAGECPSEYLERIHSDAMGCIAARNDENDIAGDISLTQNIDDILRRAAQSMPDRWWLLPTANRRSESNDVGNVKSLEDVLRILLQITHFKFKSACVNASRELVARYIKFRYANQVSFCCRGIDFSAFVACLALLLAHLKRSSQRSEVADFLAHQRSSDRATIEEVIDLMMEFNTASSDSLLEQTACILKSFLDIENDAHVLERCSDQPRDGQERWSRPCEYSLRLNIPYFGLVLITRRGISQQGTHLPFSNSALSTGIPLSEVESEIRSTRFQGNDFPSLSTSQDDLLSFFPFIQQSTCDPNMAAGPDDCPLQIDSSRSFFDPALGSEGGIIEGIFQNVGEDFSVDH